MFLSTNSQAYYGKTVSIDYRFTSEAPGSAGLPQKRMLLMNNAPDIIYDDMLALSSAAFMLTVTRSDSIKQYE